MKANAKNLIQSVLNSLGLTYYEKIGLLEIVKNELKAYEDYHEKVKSEDELIEQLEREEKEWYENNRKRKEKDYPTIFQDVKPKLPNVLKKKKKEPKPV